MTQRNLETHPIKICPGCSAELSFHQSYGFHAGFSNLGFLYDETGTRVFVWSSFDLDYSRIVGDKHPWTLDESEQRQLEANLRPSPSGTRWSFRNPARCSSCGHPISGPITETIMGLALEESPEPLSRAIEVPFRTYWIGALHD